MSTVTLTGTLPGPLTGPLTGTGILTRLALRRDRLMIPVWALVTVVGPAAFVAVTATRRVLPTSAGTAP